jgi:hypothetical protein
MQEAPRGRVVISVQDCAKFAELAEKEICLAPSVNARRRVLRSCSLLTRRRGLNAFRKLIVADIRRWTELGTPDRAADACVMLRQFLSGFPEARIKVTPASASIGAPWTRSYEMCCRRGQSRSRRRAFKVITPESDGARSGEKILQDARCDRRSSRPLTADLVHGGDHERRARPGRGTSRFMSLSQAHSFGSAEIISPVPRA